MSERPDSALEALVELARRAEPPALSPLEARRMVRTATARAFAPRRRRARWAWLAAAALSVCAASFLTFTLVTERGMIALGAGDRSLRLALKTGDEVIAAPGAQLEVVTQRAARRRVRLAQGGALFDVRALGAGQRFEVDTVHAQVQVVGTLFSVEVAPGRTIVRVYEGRVRVAGRHLEAGEVWASQGRPPQFAAGPLADDARAALAARTAHARTDEPRATLVRRAHAPGDETPPTLAAPTADVLTGEVRAGAVDAGDPRADPGQRVVAALAPPGAEPRTDQAQVAAGPRGLVSLAARARVAAQAPAAAEVLRAESSAHSNPARVGPDSAPLGAASTRAGVAGTNSEATGVAGTNGVAAGEGVLAELVRAESDVDDATALAQARAWLVTGASERALAAARAHADSDDPGWLLLYADALRALGRFVQAAYGYERVAQLERGIRRSEAGYSAAAIALHDLHDPRRALALLDAFALDGDQSALRERASVLRVYALWALGRREQARAAARRYLAREPETAVSQRLRALLR